MEKRGRHIREERGTKKPLQRKWEQSKREESPNHRRQFTPATVLRATEGLIESGHRISYVRKALYPVLEVKAVVLERNREEMGAIETIILRIASEGVETPDDIARLLGFKPIKLLPILQELLGRGLLDTDGPGKYQISRLGTMSLERGKAVFQVERALLLCGLTGALLPREIYHEPRVDPHKVQRMVRERELIEALHTIPLTELSIDRIRDKRRVNLSDETIDILGVTETTPYFFQGILALYSDTCGNKLARIALQRATVDWLTPRQVMPILEPLGYSASMTPEQVTTEISKELRLMGATITSAVSDTTLQGLTVGIAAVDASFVSLRLDDRSLAMFLGTNRHAAIPISRFPLLPKRARSNGQEAVPFQKPPADLLFGRTLCLIADNPELEQVVSVLRTCEDLWNRYDSLPLEVRRRKEKKMYIREKLDEMGIQLAEVRRSLEVIPDARFSRTAATPEEEKQEVELPETEAGPEFDVQYSEGEACDARADMMADTAEIDIIELTITADDDDLEASPASGIA